MPRKQDTDAHLPGEGEGASSFESALGEGGDVKGKLPPWFRGWSDHLTKSGRARGNFTTGGKQQGHSMLRGESENSLLTAKVKRKK